VCAVGVGKPLELVSAKTQDISPKENNSRPTNGTIYQRRKNRMVDLRFSHKPKRNHLWKQGFKSANKFGAIRTDGFASKGEAAVFQILKLREKSGEITGIRHPARVHLTCGIYWNVDFNFISVKSGHTIWAEYKGFEDRRYRMCKKLWEGGFGPGTLEIWKGSWMRPMLVEVVKPKLYEEKKDANKRG
jgi:hypothetical protein